MKTIRSVDGKVQTAEVQVDQRSYTRLVAKLIELYSLWYGSLSQRMLRQQPPWTVEPLQELIHTAN